MGRCDVVGPAFPRVYLVIDEIATLSVPFFRLQFIIFEIDIARREGI